MTAHNQISPGTEHLDWAVARWNAEVLNRPLQNVHRRSLDTTWRQVIRHFGGDPVKLCGPDHDDLIAVTPGFAGPDRNMPLEGYPDIAQAPATSEYVRGYQDAMKWTRELLNEKFPAKDAASPEPSTDQREGGK